MDGKHMGGICVLLGEGINGNLMHELQCQRRNNTHIFLNAKIEMSGFIHIANSIGLSSRKAFPRDKETLWTTSKRYMEKRTTTNLK